MNISQIDNNNKQTYLFSHNIERLSGITNYSQMLARITMLVQPTYLIKNSQYDICLTIIYFSGYGKESLAKTSACIH